MSLYSRTYIEQRIAESEARIDTQQDYLVALGAASEALSVAVDAYGHTMGNYDDGTLAALSSVCGKVAAMGTVASVKQDVARRGLEKLQAQLAAMPAEAAGA